MKKMLSAILVTVMLFGVLCACDNQSQNETTQPPAAGEPLSALAFDALDVTAPAGVGFELVYESEAFIVFYGDIGLFCYDLQAQKMDFTVDFVKLYGKEGLVQGEYGTGVDVSADGSTIVITYTDPDALETVYDACYISLPEKVYHMDAYQALDEVYDRESSYGMVIPGGSIGGTTYDNGENKWQVFAEYRDA